jgi:hypothetical protein
MPLSVPNLLQQQQHMAGAAASGNMQLMQQLAHISVTTYRLRPIYTAPITANALADAEQPANTALNVLGRGVMPALHTDCPARTSSICECS